MKKVLLAAFLLASSHAMFAQVNKGQWLVGGSASFSHTKYGSTDAGKSTTFQLSPDAGYFFIDKLAGGLRFDYTHTKVKAYDDAYVFYSFAPFLRYYFLDAAQKVNVFADASYGFGKEGSTNKESFNYYSIKAGPAVFLSPNTALEFTLGYNSYGGDYYGDDRSNTIGFNVGFQIHLGGK